MKKYIKYKIKSKYDGIIYHEIPYAEYERRLKEDILIGISFTEYELIDKEIIYKDE